MFFQCIPCVPKQQTHSETENQIETKQSFHIVIPYHLTYVNRLLPLVSPFAITNQPQCDIIPSCPLSTLHPFSLTKF